LNEWYRNRESVDGYTESFRRRSCLEEVRGKAIQ